MNDRALSAAARRLREAVEPLAASVYFAPEAHGAYQELGFAGSPGASRGVARPDPVAYFTSRGACMGQVPGEVVAAAFGVFDPAVVVPAVAAGWAITDPPTVLDARLRGATGQLRRILGPEPDGLGRATAVLRRAADAADGAGRHLFSGLRSLGFPADPMGDLWRAADLVREYRGDSHVAAWVTSGLDPVEIGLLTDLWRGLPLKSWVRSRGWGDAALDAGVERLRSAGLLDADALSPAGWDRREAIEAATDRQDRPVVEAIGDDANELLGLLEPWAAAVVAAGGYPAAASRVADRPS